MDALRFLTLDSLCEVLDLRFLDLPFKTNFLTKTAFNTFKKSFDNFGSVFANVPYLHSSDSFHFYIKPNTQNCQYTKIQYSVTKKLEWLAPIYAFLTKPTINEGAKVAVSEVIEQKLNGPVWIPTKQQTLIGSLQNYAHRYIENIDVYAPVFIALLILLLALFQVFKNPAAPSALFNSKHSAQDEHREPSQNLLLKHFKQTKLWVWLRRLLSKYTRK